MYIFKFICEIKHQICVNRDLIDYRRLFICERLFCILNIFDQTDKVIPLNRKICMKSNLKAFSIRQEEQFSQQNGDE